MVLEPGETCCRFVDKVKEQANKLANMGEKVSNTNLLTRLKEGVCKIFPLLAHNLYIQGSEDVKVVEDLIRGYDNTPMAKQLLTDATKSVDKVNAVAETSRKRPNNCAVGDVTKGVIWRRTTGDHLRRDQIEMGERIVLDTMYLESAMCVSQQDTFKLTVQRLGMEIVRTIQMLSPHLGVIRRKPFQIKVGLLGIAVHHNSESESTAEMAQTKIVVSIIRQ